MVEIEKWNYEEFVKLNQGAFSYEEINGEFFVIVNWHKLDIPFQNGEELIQAMILIDYVMKLYREEGHTGRFYVQEDILFNWYNDLVVDNRTILPDTIFLTDEAMKKYQIWADINTMDYDFWKRDFKEKEKFANFLNNIL
jgi:hypothetical protein